MPGFCTGCGAPLAGAFCGRCGKPAPSSSAPPQPAAAPKKSSAGKLFLIVGVIVLALFALGLGGVVLGVHWIKDRVSSLTGGVIGGSGQVQVSQGNACSLLSRSELQQVLGVTVERNSEIMEGNEPGCAYFTNPDAFKELQRIAVEQAKRDSEKASRDPALNNSKSDNPLELLKHTEEMEGIVKGFGLSAPNPDGRVFAFTVDRNFGSVHWSTLRAAMSAVPGFKEVEGVGDHAMIGSFGHAFYVLKGDSMVKMETMFVPEARVRGAELGRKLVSHM